MSRKRATDMPKGWPPSREQMLAWKGEGLSDRAIAEKLHVDFRSVGRLREVLNIPTAPNGRPKGAAPSPQIKQVQKNLWVSHRKRPDSYIPDSEIDALIAAYTKPITYCPPMGALGDIPPEVAA